jgi:predicted AlkP superfamily pyrophosphatase or phosphodiesterase
MKRSLLLVIISALFIANTAFGAKWKANHVILIGLDGWGSYSVEKAEMPVVKKLMNEGSYTLKKRSVLPSSSAVNWASMFMGASPELHGYTEWGSQKPEVGYIYEWDGMAYLAEIKAINYVELSKDCEKTPSVTSKSAAEYIRNHHPNLLGVIFNNPDEIGHHDGHDTPAYYQKLKELDTYIGQIVDAVKDAGMLEETIFIVTSDHGGINTGHGGKTMMEMETPFIISGKNVKKIPEFKESMMQFDVAPTIAFIFGLQTPQVWIGRPMKQLFK